MATAMSSSYSLGATDSWYAFSANLKYVAVEGYANISDKRNDFDFQGPVRLYKKAGFVEIMRADGKAIMRKLL